MTARIIHKTLVTLHVPTNSLQGKTHVEEVFTQQKVLKSGYDTTLHHITLCLSVVTNHPLSDDSIRRNFDRHNTKFQIKSTPDNTTRESGSNMQSTKFKFRFLIVGCSTLAFPTRFLIGGCSTLAFPTRSACHMKRLSRSLGMATPCNQTRRELANLLRSVESGAIATKMILSAGVGSNIHTWRQTGNRCHNCRLASCP